MNLKSTWKKMNVLTMIILPRRILLGKKSKQRTVLKDPEEEIQEISLRKEDIVQSQDQEDPDLQMIAEEETKEGILRTHLNLR